MICAHGDSLEDDDMQLGYFGLEVSSLDEWEEFGTQVIGLAATRDADGTLGLRLDSYARRFVITEGPLNSMSFAGFELAGAEAFAVYRRRLEEHGVSVHDGTPEERTRRKVENFAWFLEPNGLRFEIFYGPEQATTVFNSPLVECGFKTDAEVGIGHMVVCTADLRNSEDFYTRVLGFDVSNRGQVDKKFNAVFTRCNHRHHTVAICEFRPELPITLDNNLAHIMVEVNSMEDVGRVHDQAVRNGVPITMSLGRHPDGIFSFYCKSPSGMEFEVGAGSVIVDSDDWPVDTWYETSEWGHFTPDGWQLGKPGQPKVPASVG
jgi:2,3-dihydroxybiphenyl 1,2-dioxygenase